MVLNTSGLSKEVLSHQIQTIKNYLINLKIQKIQFLK